MSWAEAFLKQACSDYVILKSLNEQADVPECHRLHYLQMACEKLAKYHACLGSDEKTKATQYALLPLIKQLPHMPQMRKLMGYAQNSEARSSISSSS
jgi:hypothetical protein